jgi:hypothetical protein
MRHWLGSDRLTLGLLGLAMGLLCLSGQEDIAVEESDVEGAVSASELKPTADGDLFESLESVDDARVLAWAKDLGLEERRYILYLYGRLNRPKVAERLAVDILADDPSNKAALLVLASMYVEQQNPEKALVIGRRLVKYYPKDDQALYFLGASHWLAGQYQEANRVFRDLKIDQFPRKKYPYTTDLASSALLSGDWYRAMLAYQELLRHHDLGDELRDQVRIVLDGIYRTYLPQLYSRYAINFLDFGQLDRLSIGYEYQLSDSKRLFVDIRHDQLQLDATEVFRANLSDRQQVGIKLASVHSGRWEHELSLGGYGDGVMYGGRLIRNFTPQREVALVMQGNERATDSLLFELLDGRQNRVGAEVKYQFEDEWYLTVDPSLRQSLLDGESIGSGYSVNWSIEKVLFAQSPEVRIGYRGILMQFWDDVDDFSFVDSFLAPGITPAARREAATNVVSPLIHRHGLYTAVNDNLADAWKYRVMVGADYIDEQSTIGYGGEAELAFWPRKSIELTTGAAYSSNASTSDSSSGLLQVNFGFRYYF